LPYSGPPDFIVHTHIINSGFFDCNTQQTAGKREKMNNGMVFQTENGKEEGIQNMIQR
jgi:hypothetical protein